MSLTCDWVLGIVNQQHQPVSVILDGFICTVGCGLYVCLCYFVGCLCTMPAVVTQYPLHIVIVALEGLAWATGGVRGKYIWPLPVISPVSL
jgi:flagellar biosynthesis protein FliR